MTVSIKGLIAGLVTVAAIGTAFAQSSPPNPAASNQIGRASCRERV